MSFVADLNCGHVGEFVFWNLFTNLPTVKEVIDVRRDKGFQNWDVDFLVKDVKEQITWIEVKTDYKTFHTGNIVYEYQTSGNIGCYEKTKADYIAYYVPQSGNIYILKTEELRRLVRTHDYKLMKVSNDTTGYLISLGDLERYGVVKGVYQAERIPDGRVD